MALKATKEQVMNAISSLGFEVFKNGSFHWNSSNTPDMKINERGSIHCWTTNPFNNYTKNHGDLIDFLQLINPTSKFNELKDQAYILLNLPIQIDSSKEKTTNNHVKSEFISKDFIEEFKNQRVENFDRFRELLNEALPSMSFTKQKELALKYQIGYIKQSDRLIMPIIDENENIITFWKYNKNPKPFLDENDKEIKLPKVLFSKGRKRTIFNITDLKQYQKDKDTEIYLCAGEKDTLNMLGNGYRAITLGAENSDIQKEHLNLFSNLKIIVAYDYDDAGKKGTEKIVNQLEGVTKSVKSWDWENEAKKYNLNLFKGFDMTDFLAEIHCRNKKVFTLKHRTTNTKNLER